MDREIASGDRGRNYGSITGGLIVLALGALMFADRSGYAQAHLMRFFPGVVLLLLGVVSLTTGRRTRRGRRPFGGLWLVVVGTWMIASQGQLFGLTFHTSWPLLIVGIGLLMVVRGLWYGAPPPIERSAEDGR